MFKFDFLASSFLSLQFRFAKGMDIVMFLFGTIGASCVGCGLPINFLIFGQVLDQFIGKGANDYVQQATPAPNATMPSMESIVFDLTKWFMILAACLFVAAFMQMFCWQYSALRQTIRFRMNLFASMVYKDVSWHDSHATGDLVTRLSDQVRLNILHILRVLIK